MKNIQWIVFENKQIRSSEKWVSNIKTRIVILLFSMGNVRSSVLKNPPDPGDLRTSPYYVTTEFVIYK